MSFNNPIPVAVALIFNADHSNVLVGERAIEPFIGGAALIGGYIDEGETPDVALRREVQEETGRTIGQAPLHYESSAITANNRLLLFFSTHVPDLVFENTQDSNEMRNIRFVEPSELQANPLCFSLHQEALLKAWKAKRPDLFLQNAPTMLP